MVLADGRPHLGLLTARMKNEQRKNTWYCNLCTVTPATFNHSSISIWRLDQTRNVSSP